MPDHATSSSPAVQAQLDRLWRLSPGADILGLERITALLAWLGDPHLRLPPVLHVAGTNGKGSTCAFLRAAIEAAGLRCHVYTSPHLVRFNERVRLAGRLIEDEPLAALLAEVLDRAEGLNASFFEVTTAAAFLAFSRTPADACIVEVGLGGRLDATNVIPAPRVAGIAQLGIDHQAFLGDTIEAIAGEKAGIAKPGVPLVTMRYPASVAQRVAEVARAAGAELVAEGQGWRFHVDDELTVEDAAGQVTVPVPAIVGAHQSANLALAIAMLRQSGLLIPDAALAVAARRAQWPARMQRLDRTGPLGRLVPCQLWLDGGHNPAAGEAVAASLATIAAALHAPLRRQHTRPACHLILGMLANKDPAGLLAPLAPLVESVTAVPVPDHEHHAPAELARIAADLDVATTATAPDVPSALRLLAKEQLRDMPAPQVVLILGSLYLAGEVLQLNDELPD